MNVAGLVQLCQFEHPASYFSALESGATPPRSPEELASFVTSMLKDTLGPTEGIAAGIAFRAARGGSLEVLPQVARALDHMPTPKRRASVQTGEYLWGLSRRWPWTTPIHQQVDPLTPLTDLHHAIAFGTLASETTSSQLRAIATCLFNTARNIILAACRAIPLPESEGERLLAGIGPEITTLAARYADRHAADILIR
jgi:urease accessory protein UreF